jgi:hypothetical protein
MKRLAAPTAALFLAACGPTLDGNWTININSSGTTCNGTMHIDQTSGGADSGTWGCAGSTGSVSGSIKGKSVSLNFQPSGNFQPFLVTGTTDGATIDGAINGSGFQNATFHAAHQ